MEFMTQLQGGVDEHKPSLFELLSEQQLSNLLSPSVRYLLALATQRHPRYLIHMLNNYDEVYAALSLLVEHHFLTNYTGSFTENFYGLKRERVLRTRAGELPRAQLGAPSLVRETLKLRRADVWKNLAILVAVPYVKGKLDQGHDLHAPAASAVVLGPQYSRDELAPDATARQSMAWYYKWFLKKVYPHINAAYYLSMLCFQLAYLFDGSKYSSPLLWLIGTRMRRLGEADHRAFEAALEPASAAGSASGSPKPRPGQSNSIFNPRVLASVVIPRLLSSLRILLPTSIFALKFLEWWHASDFARQLSRKAAEGLELAPPVLSLKPRTSLPSSPPSSQVRKTSSPPQSSSSSPSPSSSSPPRSLLPKKQRSSSGSAPLHPALKKSTKPPVSTTSLLPIFTVPSTTGDAASHTCPICLSDVVNATASPYGYVYCYVCIHKWVEGEHDRQDKFMQGGPLSVLDDGTSAAAPMEEANVWDEDDDDGEAGRAQGGLHEESEVAGSREGRWESGKGRCAVSGLRILGGTEGLRRVVV